MKNRLYILLYFLLPALGIAGWFFIVCFVTNIWSTDQMSQDQRFVIVIGGTLIAIWSVVLAAYIDPNVEKK